MSATRFDLDGTNPDNRIINEIHRVDKDKSQFMRYLVPRAAPFHSVNFVVRMEGDNGMVLTPDVDYIFLAPYSAINNAIMSYVENNTRVFGIVAIVNPNIDGNVVIEYQSIGTDNRANAIHVLERMISGRYNPRTVYFEQITNVPLQLPPDLHLTPVTDIVGMGDLIASINRLTDAVLTVKV